MKKNTIKLVGITIAVLLVVTGCGKVPKLENGKDAVVTLKGEDISVDDLYKSVKERYALSTLLDMIDTKILNKKYKDTKDFKKEIEDTIDLYVNQYGGGDESKLLEQTYQAWGVDTIDELRDYLSLQKKRSTAVEDYAKSIVSDDEIEKYYDENYFGDITAKHILIAPKVDSNATDAEKQEAEENALKTAKEVISKLKNGEDFDALAKEYSTDDSNKDKGGLLPKFNHGDMSTEFEKAAKELKVETYTTTPVKTSFGYHIIYKVSEDEKPALKTVKSDIVDEIAKNKLNDDATLQVTALEELRKDYKVNIQDDSLKDQYERYIKNLKEQYSNN